MKGQCPEAHYSMEDERNGALTGCNERSLY